MNTKRLYEILLAPHTTEKTVVAAEAHSQVAFKVAKNANKHEIKTAVEKLFSGIKVLAVRTANIKAKRKRFKQVQGKKPGFKKALVFLEKGQDINIAEFE